MANCSATGKKLLVFENKILRKICGPVVDIELNIWRRRKNTELREITKIPLLNVKDSSGLVMLCEKQKLQV